jgi:hypothetical protein
MRALPPHPPIAGAMGLSLSRKARGLSIAALLALAALALGGCGLREASLSDRCGEMMRDAFPSGKIKVTKADVAGDPAGASVTSMVAAVSGVRRNVAEGDVLARDVAVECRFEDNILTGFRWTAGPLQAPER